MKHTLTYLSATVAWGLALTLLLAAMLASARSPADALRDLPSLFATMFPIAAIAGGAYLSGTRTRTLFAAGSFGAVVAFLLGGFIAPWLEVTVGSSVTASMFPSWVHEHRTLLAARERGAPVLGWMITVSGLHMWQPVVAAGLALVLTPLGAIVAESRGGGQYAAGRWTAIAVVLTVVTLAQRCVLALTLEDGAALAIASLSVVAIPALMLVTALWTRAALTARA